MLLVIGSCRDFSLHSPLLLPVTITVSIKLVLPLSTLSRSLPIIVLHYYCMLFVISIVNIATVNIDFLVS